SRRTVSRLDPGPVTVRFPVVAVSDGRADSRAIVLGVPNVPAANVIVSAAGLRTDPTTASRKLPEPLSLVLVTTYGVWTWNEPAGPAATKLSSRSLTVLATTWTEYRPLSTPSHEPPGG